MHGRRRVPARLVVLPDDPSVSFVISVNDTCGARLGDKVAVTLKRTHGGEAVGGEIFATLGCTEAINLDGGGSSTFIIRDEEGNFDVKNSPSDGGLRSVANGLMVVLP